MKKICMGFPVNFPEISCYVNNERFSFLIFYNVGCTLFVFCFLRVFCECCRETHQKIRNTHYTLFILHANFCVLLMPRKNKPRNPLTFRTNANPGMKCCKMRKAKEKGQRKTWNTPLYIFRFSHFVIVFACFAIRQAICLSWNMWKQSENAKNEKCIAAYFASLFSHFGPLFCFSHFAPELSFMWKVEGFHGLFFCGINETWNSHEIRKVYKECLIFCAVFPENICEITMKCGIRKVYSLPNEV